MFQVVVVKLERNAQSHWHGLQSLAGHADYPQPKKPSI